MELRQLRLLQGARSLARERPEAAVDPITLQDFPALQAALNHFGAGEVTGDSHLAGLLSILDSTGVDYGVAVVEGALASLLSRFLLTELQEQVDALFADDHEWDKATSELLGLSHFHRLGLLRQTGWPSGGGKTPPFDGVVEVAGHRVPFDVKSASGTGVNWLDEALSPAVHAWAAARGAPSVEVVFRWDGPITKQAIAKHRIALLEQLNKQLRLLRTTPAKASLRAGKTTIEVTIRHRTGGRVHGGVVFVEPHADSILETLGTHARDKGKQAAKHGEVPFFLAYVRPPGRGGSDIAGYAMATALRALNLAATGPAADLWLGTLSLDWTPRCGDPVISEGLIRPDAQWPKGLDSDLFARALGVAPWPLVLT